MRWVQCDVRTGRATGTAGTAGTGTVDSARVGLSTTADRTRQGGCPKTARKYKFIVLSDRSKTQRIDASETNNRGARMQLDLSAEAQTGGGALAR